MNEQPGEPDTEGRETGLSAHDLLVAHSGGESQIVQPQFRLDSLSVARPAQEWGGGVKLIITIAGETTTFLLDDAARQALVEQLSIPGEPLNLRAFAASPDSAVPRTAAEADSAGDPAVRNQRLSAICELQKAEQREPDPVMADLVAKLSARLQSQSTGR